MPKSTMKSLTTARGNPYVTMVWLTLLGSFMLFLFLIMIFSVRINGLGWEKIELPPSFYISSVCIVISSVTLHLSRINLRNEEFRSVYLWLTLTLLLAIGFGVLQCIGWNNLFIRNSPASHTSMAFTYLISGLHFLHIVLGLGALAWLWNGFRKNVRYVDSFVYTLNPKTATVYQTATIFWHFLGILWLLLFLVLWVNQP